MHAGRSCLCRGQRQVQGAVVRVHHRAPLKSSEREKLAQGRGFGNCSGSKAGQRTRGVPLCTSTAAAAEPPPEGKLEVTFTQSYIFPALQILQSGCNRDICSWTEKLSGDWLGEGRKEGSRRKEGRRVAHPRGRAKGLPRFGKAVKQLFTHQPLLRDQ